jgi:hypothetical protein
MIDLRNITEPGLIKSYLSEKISIYAKYYGIKITARLDDGVMTYYKNKKQPITTVDFIINDSYSTPIDIIKNMGYLLEPGKDNHFTYNPHDDVLIWNNPTNGIKHDSVINNGSIFEGKLDGDTMNMFIRKHTNKIIKHLDPKIGVKPTSFIIKSGDKQLFKVENTSSKPPPYVCSYDTKKLFQELISSIDINDISKLCLEESNETHVYMKIVNKIFMKFLLGKDRDWAKISVGVPDNYKPSNISNKYEYLSDDVKMLLMENPDSYCFYSMIMSQFRKDKIFVGKDNEMVNNKYKKIHKKMRDVCITNIFSTSLPPIHEILK